MENIKPARMIWFSSIIHRNDPVSFLTRSSYMKKLMTMMLGLSLAMGAMTAFAGDDKKEGDKKESKKKSGKKKKADDKK